MELENVANAPGAIGPYSHAVTHNDLIFCSGQISLDPETMELVGHSIQTQAKQVMKNIETILTGLGSSMDRIIKATVFLDNMDDFANMNSVYESCLNGHKPARSVFEVARLPKGALIEVECIAAKAADQIEEV